MALFNLSPQAQVLAFAFLAFVIVGAPPTYKLTSKILSVIKMRTADAAGTPTNTGLLIHAAVYTALLHLFLKTR